MAYNGSGTFNRLYSWSQDFADGLFIDSSKMDDEFNGIADGLSMALLKDGQQSPIANIPWGGFKITNLGDATTATDAVNRQSGDARWQGLDAELTAIAGLASAPDRLPYFTGSGTAALATLTSAGRALVDDADTAAQRATLGLVIGTDVQPFDAELAALAGLTSAADALPYFTGSGTAALTTLTGFARSLLDDANAAAFLTTLDAELAAIAGLTSAANKLPYFTGSGSAALADFTSFGRSLVDDADASAARTTLGLVIGTNVQAFDAELSAIAGLTSAADKLPYFTGAGTAALTDLPSQARTFLAYATAADQFNNIKQAASESATGVSEQATTAETVAGTDTSRHIVPAGLAAATWGAEAVAVFNAVTAAGLTWSRKELIARTIGLLKYYAIWDELDAIWFLAAFDATTAQVNWKTPGTYNLTTVNSPSFTKDQGYAGNGTNAYLSTGYTPDGNGAYKQDDASVGIHITAGSIGGRSILGQVSGTLRLNMITNSSGTLLTRFNDSSNNTTVNATEVGTFSVDRASGANYGKYLDGGVLETETQASTGLPGGAITLLANPTGSSFSDSNAAAAWVGGSLGATKQNIVSAIIYSYLNKVGSASL